MKFRQSKGNNSSITNDTLVKLHVHNYTVVIYIQYKVHEITSIFFCSVILCVLSSFEVIRERERERERGVFIVFCCRVVVRVMCIFFTVPWVGLWSSVVPFPGHT